MKKWLDEFLSDFHKIHLKNLGYKKKYHTFSIDRGTYWERYNFQGSAYNPTEGNEGTFYLNVGVEFKDLEPRTSWTWFGNTHSAWRLHCDATVPGGGWEYDEKLNKEELMHKLLDLIEETSQEIAEGIADIRSRYLEHLSSKSME